MNNNAKDKTPQAHEGSQQTGSQFNPTTPTTPYPGLQQMDRDLQASLTSPHPADSPKLASQLQRVPRPFDTELAPADHPDKANSHKKTHKAIQRWLSETQKERAWVNIGAVGKEPDGKRVLKASGPGAKGWSDGAQDGSGHVRDRS